MIHGRWKHALRSGRTSAAVFSGDQSEGGFRPSEEVVGQVVLRARAAWEGVPRFARAVMDGDALRSSDTAGACSDEPVAIHVHLEAGSVLTTGCVEQFGDSGGLETVLPAHFG